MTRWRHDIPTPALLLDLEAFEWNVNKMAAHLAARRLGFRPHGKTHKCPDIARRLIAAGAMGICAAKLSEAEVFAAHGIGGLLITTPVIGAGKIQRAIQLAQQAPDTIFCVDDADNVRDLNNAARGASAQIRLAVDLYFGRTGIAPGEPALRLAQLIDSSSHATFAGLQAYDSAASHVAGFAARAARTRETMAQAIETRHLIERSGLACSMLSCGSTGTYLLDADMPGITELQPGSFVFMDVDYGRIGGPAGAHYDEFRTALTVIATVVSAQPASAIVDAGYKAFSTDRPFMPEPVDRPGLSYVWAGDEHGRLQFEGACTVKVGERIELVPPHCDPTVNLYDCIYAMRGDHVEHVWPVAARGMSQ